MSGFFAPGTPDREADCAHAGPPMPTGQRPASREPMRIAGTRVLARDWIDVRHPWSGEIVSSVPCASADDVQAAFDQAKTCRTRLSRHERHGILVAAARRLEERGESFALTISLESGLCLKDARYEVRRSCEGIEEIRCEVESEVAHAVARLEGACGSLAIPLVPGAVEQVRSALGILRAYRRVLEHVELAADEAKRG